MTLAITGIGSRIADVAEDAAEPSGSPERPGLARVAPSVDIYDAAGPHLARRVSRGSLLAVAAARAAWEDAGLHRGGPSDRMAVVAAVTHPVLTFVEAFHASCLTGEADDPGPSFFAAAVHNAPAFAVMQALKLRGVAQTLVGDAMAGVEAFRSAEELIETRGVAGALVIAVTEATDALADGYAYLGGLEACHGGRDPGERHPLQHRRPVIGEGAVAFVVEPADRAEARGAPASARLHAAVSGTGSSWTEAATRVWETLGPAGGLLVPSCNGTPRDTFEVRCLRQWKESRSGARVAEHVNDPEAFCVSFFIQVLAALAALKADLRIGPVWAHALGKGPRYGVVGLEAPGA